MSIIVTDHTELQNEEAANEASRTAKTLQRVSDFTTEELMTKLRSLWMWLDEEDVNQYCPERSIQETTIVNSVDAIRADASYVTEKESLTKLLIDLLLRQLKEDLQ